MMKPTIKSLQNDLIAFKTHLVHVRDENEKLRRDHALQSNALVTAYRERDDWRDAFKTVSRLVK